MAMAYHCTECKSNWPYFSSFKVCPDCGIPCRTAATTRVMTSQEAQKRVKTLAFIRYYEQREAKREGPTPEEIGLEEAMAEVAQIRQLNDAYGSGG